jgi:cephalosporin-C deacetylase
MEYVDKYKNELLKYSPPLTKRDDFEDFWSNTLKQARDVPLNPVREIYDYPSPFVKVFDISYNGFDDTRIHGWFIVPNFIHSDKYPCLIHYHAYGASRGIPTDFMHWVSMGVAVLSVDCREQCGNTGNSARYSNGSVQSVSCKGILDKDEYYYRAVYMDSIKAIDFACAQPEIDVTRIIVEGQSQGGGLGMVVSALDDRPWLAMVDIPSNSDLVSRVEGSHGSFASVAEYLKVFPGHSEKAFETLSYFDTMNMADKIKCKVLASVGLRDNICPARMYFATYNRIQSSKEIYLYPFSEHERGGSVHGGGSLQEELKLRFLQDNLLLMA